MPFAALTQDTIPLNTTYSFEVNDVEGYVYSWWYTNEAGDITRLASTEYKTENYLWDTEGKFEINAQATDANNCLSEIISKPFVVIEPAEELIVSAGRDTTIGSCDPYQLQASVSDPSGLSYLWDPTENLDDAEVLNPIFNPVSSTTFILTVTTAENTVLKDTVVITVSDIYADAGEDILMEDGETAMLDGTASFGEQLQYLWTTEDGNIVSGENTANPIVDAHGTYYLQVSDFYACQATDTVVVSRVTYAPIANDDYDTTRYETAVIIPVLENDEDPDGDLDPTSLSIVQQPGYGTVYINYDDYTVTYTPADGFFGNDAFKYRVCDLTDKCDEANVFVFVLEAKLHIPEAFTPNGDNVNDFFTIEGIEQFEGNSLTIINRWGKKVYEARNYGISTSPVFWDGKWQKNGNSQDVPTGTYFYVLDLGNGEQPIAGSVYIDR